MNQLLKQRLAQAVRQAAQPVTHGRLVKVTGMVLEAYVPEARINDIVEVEGDAGPVAANVVGFREELALCVPYAGVSGLAPGARVSVKRDGGRMVVSDAMIGRVIDPFGHPLDDGPPIVGDEVPLDAPAPPALQRQGIQEPLETGVRVIDGLLTCGRGQRVGIFAGAGVGKTVLIRQISEQCNADVTVFGLIGERGCEVHDLMAARTDKSILVVSTSDRSPLERARGATAATTIAEYFRDRGKHVLLILDSLTRFAMALREIGLAAGEPPATKGYPPSVFAALPKILERVAPMKSGGSITGIYTVLVEGDDMSDPVADSARSLLDGHIVLSRDLAARGHFPAVDVLASASRVSRQVTDRPTQDLAQRARSLLAIRREVDELKSLGAYQAGANPAHDEAVQVGARLDAWSAQRSDEKSSIGDTFGALAKALERRKN